LAGLVSAGGGSAVAGFAAACVDEGDLESTKLLVVPAPM